LAPHDRPTLRTNQTSFAGNQAESIPEVVINLCSFMCQQPAVHAADVREVNGDTSSKHLPKDDKRTGQRYARGVTKSE